MKPLPKNTVARLYALIAEDDTKRLNYNAMRYFVRKSDYASAAKCRDRVGTWDAKGPR